MPRSFASSSASSDSRPFTLADLRRALDEKEGELLELLDRKEALAADLDELGATLTAMLAGATSSPGRVSRATGSTRSKRTLNTDESEDGTPPRRSRGPRKIAQGAAGMGHAREGSLPAVIRSVLERVIGPMRVGEIADAAVKAGYATKSDNLAIIVSNRLAQMADVEKVDRGLYQLRRGGARAAAAGVEAASGATVDSAPATG